MATAIDDKHLTLIQGVINRLAGNSFSLKGWSMTLVSALLALSARDSAPWTVMIALLPAVTFWGLDGYFLAQEKLFRTLYTKVITPGCAVPPFSMQTEPLTRRTWIGATFSGTLIPFHGTVLGAVILILLYQTVGTA
jgi:hypothetical protein